MKVAILTMFSGLSQTYSLVNVVAEHIQMLLEHNIQVKLIVTEDCYPQEGDGIYLDSRIEWVKIKHTLGGKPIKLYDYSNPDMTLHTTFFKEVTSFQKQFRTALEDVDICMMHDILYQGWNYVYNIAIRNVQKEMPHLRFLSFTHSFPVNRPTELQEEMQGRYMPMDHTLFIYPTASGIPSLAKQYHVPEGNCRVLYNSSSLISSLCSEVQELHKSINLLESEVLIIYPGRLTTGKKFDKVVALAGSIKKIGEKTVKVVFCDFPCSDTPSKEYKEAIYYVGNFYGLSKQEILFTSDHGFPDGFPHQGVLDLFSLSNLYICPSFSESFGLTVLEAASKGNFLVLNESVPALEEIGKLLGSYFMRWDARNYGYDTKEEYLPNEHAYYDKHSGQIVKLMREDKALFSKTTIRTRFNSDWIWENQFKPLLEN